MAIENVLKTGFMLKLKLQHFAEETPPENDETNKQTDPADPPEGDNKAGTGDGQQKPEDKSKTFSQEDVQNIASRERKEEREKFLRELGIDDFENAKEGMEKFKEWQESQKTEQQKQQEAFETAQQQITEYEKEKQALAYENTALKLDVNTENIDDVVALAERRVTDKVDIEQAMKEVVEQYPQFKKADTAPQPNQQQPHFLGGSHKSDNQQSDPFAAKVAKYTKN